MLVLELSFKKSFVVEIEPLINSRLKFRVFENRSPFDTFVLVPSKNDWFIFLSRNNEERFVSEPS